MKPQTALYFTTICPRGARDVFLGGHLIVEGTEPTGTSLLSIQDGKWKFISTLPAVVIGLAPDATPDKTVALGRRGEVFRANGVTKEVTNERIDLRGPTYLSGLLWDGVRHLAFGGSHQVYSGAKGEWTPIDEGIFREFVVGQLHMIYAAAVLPRDHTEPPTLMVGGRSGFAARLRGESWAILDPQTNVDFHTVLPLEDGRVLFAGVSGAAMTLDGDDRWQDHTEDLAIERTVWGGAVYRERIYLGLGQELVTLEVRKDGALEVVDRREMEVNTLCANDFLWCTGDELVERFDGTDWTVFECPANS